MNRTLRIVSILALAGLCAPSTTLFSAEAEASMAETGGIAGTLKIEGQKHNGNAVVYLQGREGKKRDTKDHTMWQKEKQFSPQVLVVQKGDAVKFPNGDKIFHNVFSISRPARFDLGLYKSGDSKTVTFKRHGSVDVYCNIHPLMVGKILVTDNIHFFQTNKDGKYTLEGVPVGDYKLTVWHPDAKSVAVDVTIEAGKTAKSDLTIKLKKGGSHLRKDGTVYGRYK